MAKGFDIEGAKKEGYTDAEIIEFLKNDKEVPKEKTIDEEQVEILKNIEKAINNLKDDTDDDSKNDMVVILKSIISVQKSQEYALKEIINKKPIVIPERPKKWKVEVKDNNGVITRTAIIEAV